MLSAHAQAVPLNSDPVQSAPFRPDEPESVRRMLGRFLHRLLRRGPWRAPALPGDLHCDVGLGEGLPFDRESAFWEGRPRSHARDLPL